MPAMQENDELSLDDIDMTLTETDVLPKNLIITGQKAAGKTTLAATAEEGVAEHLANGTRSRIVLESMVWLLADEQGVTSLLVRGIRPRYMIDFRKLVAKAGGNVASACRATHEYLERTRDKGVSHCVVDTVTSLGGFLERWYVYGAGCPVSARTQGKDTQGGWGLIGNKYFELYETLSELDFRTIWLAHPKTNVVEQEAIAPKASTEKKAKAIVSGTPGDNFIIPAISGRKFADLITAQCNISGWLRANIVNDKRTTEWMPFGGDGSQGKNRYEGILDRSEPANLHAMDQKILNATQGE